MPRTDHDRVLLGYTRPPSLIATKPSSTSKQAFRGADADLRHDVWIICTDDPQMKKDPEQIFSFEHVIDVDGVRLNSAAHVHDLLTMKVWVLERLRGQYLRSISASFLYSIFLAALWLLRWRCSLSVDRMDGLSEPQFGHFCESLKKGTLGLVPWEARLERMRVAVESGTWEWPIAEERGRARCLVGTAVGERLGLQTIYPQVRAALRRLVPEIQSVAGDDVPGDAGEDGGLGQGTVSIHMYVWQDLRTLSQLGVLSHDKLQFDPFARNSFMARVREIGRVSNGRTATPGPKQWLGLLDTAARWMLDYAGPILGICAEACDAQMEYRDRDSRTRWRRSQAAVQALIDRHFPPGNDRPKLFALWRRREGAREPGMGLDEAMRHVIAACLILTGGLSARRAGELNSLQAGCAEVDAFGQHWMSSYIEKTVRSIEKLPVPAMVGHAIQILEDLSAPGRARTGTPWLMNIDRPNAALGNYEERLGHYLDIGVLINRFAEANGLSRQISDDDGKVWRYAGHQLRRAFSVYYYHGNRYGSFDALSRFLRHFDPEMTRIYVTEAFGGRLGAMREEARAAAAAAKDIEEAAKRSTSLLGEARAARARADAAAEAVRLVSSRVNAHEEVRREVGIERAFEVIDGIEAPIGVGAAVFYGDLEAMIEKARRHVRMERPDANASPDAVREALPRLLEEYVKTHWMEPVSGGFAHCRCIPADARDLARAACLDRKRAESGETDDQRPDYAYASIDDCLVGCPHGLAFSENQRVVDEVVARGQAAIKPCQLVDDIVASVKAAKAAVANRGQETL
jgi:hypothetical protein